MKQVRRWRRLDDWPERLDAWLEGAAALPHQYGRHDCLRACAGAIAAVTGVDLSLGRRGRYRTGLGAARHLRRLGFDSPAALLDSLLPVRHPAFARRGDLVAGADGIPGVCIGDRAAFVGEAGLRVEPGPWVRAWTVGEP